MPPKNAKGVRAAKIRAQNRAAISFIPLPTTVPKVITPTVAILPLGVVSNQDINFTKDVIIKHLGLNVRVLAPDYNIDHMYVQCRAQYDADQILEHLFNKLPEDCTRIMGVLSQDMYAAGRTFVFGYAHLRDGVAVYSTKRLQERWYGRNENIELEHSRSLRCIVHEMGHTFGAPHCEDYSCVMHAVCTVQNLDELPITYCYNDNERVNKNKLDDVSSAKGQFARAGANLRRKNIYAAIRYYKVACMLDPSNFSYYNDLGVAELAYNNREQAMIAFQNAINRGANIPHPYYNMGICHRDTYHGVQAATPYFVKGLSYEIDKAAGHKYLCGLYFNLFHDVSMAQWHYTKYYELGGNEDLFGFLRSMTSSNKPNDMNVSACMQK